METRIVSASTLPDRIAAWGRASTQRAHARPRRRLARRLGFTAVLLSAGLAPWHATADERPVLHEYVPAVSDDEVLEWQASSGAPAAIVYDGEVLAAPNLTAAEPPGPRMVGLPGDGLGRDEPGRRSPEFRPDRLTTLEQDVDYSVAFAPSVMPHKRVSALDRVVLASDGVPVLTAPTRPPEELPVAGASGAGRDRFWGSVTLDFRAGLRVPIPSVSPESNILSVQTEPRVPLLFERDEAGNYFVRATPGAPSVVRLAFLMDAPVGYFNRPLPDAGFPVGARAAEVVPLPPAVRDNALMFAGELGLSALSSYRLALETLVHHFRSFRETREDFGDGRDIYLDLARGMFGVCRHRAYAFTITALALGIPTHFVMNEAHAWVEVRLPDGDWMRIDLGGAAVGVRTQGDPEAPHYEPRAPDPLPRPPAYRAALARAGNPYGQSDAEGANDPSTSDSNAISEPGATSPEGSDAPNTSGTQGSSAGSSPDGTNTAGTTTGGMSTTGRTNGSARPPGAPRAGVQVRLSAASAEVVRGRAIELEGSIEDEHGAAAASMRVEVLLRGRGERLLGVAVTDAEGRFFGAFGVPHDLAVGDYRLVVRTPGDARHLPAELE